MPRIALLLILIFGCFLVLQAQDKSKADVIYFKSGKIIKGQIVKEQLGTISVLTTDSITGKEKTQVYQQNEIKKIVKNKSSNQNLIEGGASTQGKNAKVTPANTASPSDPSQEMIPEETLHEKILNPTPESTTPIPLPVMAEVPVIINATRSASPDDYFDPFSVPRPRRYERIWNRQIRGFRGFIDYAYIQGIGQAKNNRFETATSLGFQFNPILYVGIGTGANLTLNGADSSLPVFINPRINFLDQNTTPFWDVKVGYSVAMGKGFYCSTSFGVSFTKQGKRAFNLGLVYSLQNATFYENSKTEPVERVQVKEMYHGLALKLSYEFGIGR